MQLLNVIAPECFVLRSGEARIKRKILGKFTATAQKHLVVYKQEAFVTALFVIVNERAHHIPCAWPLERLCHSPPRLLSVSIVVL